MRLKTTGNIARCNYFWVLKLEELCFLSIFKSNRAITGSSELVYIIVFTTQGVVGKVNLYVCTISHIFVDFPMAKGTNIQIHFFYNSLNTRKESL